MLLSTAVDLFIASVCAGKTNGTPVVYRKKLQRFTSFVGDLPVESIKPADIERFRQALLTQNVKRRGAVEIVAPLSVWYVRGNLRMVKYLFHWLSDEGHLVGNPAARLKLPQLPQAPPKAIDPDTFDKLLEAAANSGEIWARARDVAFLCLLRDTGGRLGGILGARVADVDLEHFTLSVTEKGGKQRDVFYCEATAAAVRRWLEVRKLLHVRSEALFIGRYGAALHAGGVYGILRRLARAAGVSGQRFNPHSFRHAFARDTLRAGADLSTVSQLMGHSTIAVTGDYYARWLPSELKQAHQKTAKGRAINDPMAGDS
jgi:site-specific recombinase XerD